jgi:glutamate racemase
MTGYGETGNAVHPGMCTKIRERGGAGRGSARREMIYIWPMDPRPIGVFDSGIGGLTVARSVKEALPAESLVYFGDTAHLPYGDKSRELITEYAVRITEFLLNDRQCKSVVIACNSASAAAYETLRDRYKGSVPVINVIDPMIEAVIADDRIRKAGLIGTHTTVESGVYQEKFARRKPGLRLAALATPLLAPMIEEGYNENRISRAVLEEYLSDPVLAEIDALILACTHYPLIRKEIQEIVGNQVMIFDSGRVAAAKLKHILLKENLLCEKPGESDLFYVSDYTPSFERTTRIFFGNQVRLERVP